MKVKSENRKTSYSLTAFGHKKFSPRGGHTMDNSHNGFMRNALELFGKMMEFRSVLSPTKIIFDECHDIRHDQNSKIEMASADTVFLLKFFTNYSLRVLNISVLKKTNNFEYKYGIYNY